MLTPLAKENSICGEKKTSVPSHVSDDGHLFFRDTTPITKIPQKISPNSTSVPSLRASD